MVVNMYWLFNRKGFLEHKSIARSIHNKNFQKTRNREEFHQLDKENYRNLQLTLYLMVKDKCFPPETGNRQG